MHGSTSNLDWLSSVRPLLELNWWQHRDEPCASPRASDIGVGQLTYQPAELRLFARQKVKKAASLAHDRRGGATVGRDLTWTDTQRNRPLYVVPFLVPGRRAILLSVGAQCSSS